MSSTENFTQIAKISKKKKKKKKNAIFIKMKYPFQLKYYLDSYMLMYLFNIVTHFILKKTPPHCISEESNFNFR